MRILFKCIYFVYPAFAEIKIFEQEVEEAISRGQSQEQVEAFALQKAKRLAVEEAGTYISSLAVVRNYQLQEDEVTALASGIVQAKIVGGTSVRVENGVVHVKVKARIIGVVGTWTGGCRRRMNWRGCMIVRSTAIMVII